MQTRWTWAVFALSLVTHDVGGAEGDTGVTALERFEGAVPLSALRTQHATVRVVSRRSDGGHALQLTFSATPTGQRRYPAVVFAGEALEVTDFSTFDALRFWVKNEGEHPAELGIAVQDAGGRRSFPRPSRVSLAAGEARTVVCRWVFPGLDRRRIDSIHFFQESTPHEIVLRVDDLELLSPLAQRVLERRQQVLADIRQAIASAKDVGLESVMEGSARDLQERLRRAEHEVRDPTDRLLLLSRLAQESERLRRTLFVRNKAITFNGSHVTDDWLAAATDLADFTSVQLAGTSITDAGLRHLESLKNLYRLTLGSPGITGRGLDHLPDGKLRRLDLVGSGVSDASLASLSRFFALETLDLSHTDVTELGMKHLANLRRLKVLDLDGTGIDDDGLAHLGDLAALERLSLRSSEVSGEGLSRLSQLKRLKTLVLEDSRASDAGLLGLRAFENLEHLDLSGNPVRGPGLASLKGARKLSTLNLNGTRVNDAALAAIGPMPKLSRWMLSGTRITDATLLRLSEGGRLRYLDIYGTNVSDGGLRRLASQGELRELYLGGTAASDDAVSSYAALEKLERLDLRGTRITDRALRAVGRLKKLVTLILADCNVHDEGVEALAGLSSLRTIDLSRTAIGDSAVASLADLRELRVLKLTGTRLTDSALEALPRLEKLQDLHLDDTRVGNRGMGYVSRTSRVRRLYLDGTKVTDAGVGSLRSLKDLRTLSLSRTPITDVALSTLRESVEALHVRRTRVTNSGVQRLRGRESLVHLDLGATMVSDRGLEALSELPNLRRLALDATAITEVGLGALKKLRGLRRLNLNRTDLADVAAEVLVKFPALEEVSLEGSRVTAAGKALLQRRRPELLVQMDWPWNAEASGSGRSDGPATLSLESVWSEFSLTGDEAGVRELHGLSGVRSVDLRGARIDVATLQSLRDHARVEALDLGETNMNDELLRHLEGVPQLEALWLARTAISDEGLSQLASLRKLEYLNLDGTSVTERGLEVLAELTVLRSLSLRDTKLADRELPRLAAMRSLRKIVLTNTRIGDEGVRSLSQLPSLYYVDLFGTAVTNAGVEAIAGAPRLSHLYLGATAVTDQGVGAVGGASDLVELGLETTAVTDAGVRQLVGLRFLKRLKLSGTGVTGASVDHLAGLPTLRGLELDRARLSGADLQRLARITALNELSLDGTALTDSGLAVLSELPRLERLSVRDTRVTPSGVSAFQAQRDDVHVLSGHREQAHSRFGLLLTTLYALVAVAIGIYGLHRYALIGTFFRLRRKREALGGCFVTLPRVTIQLPLYNERNVAERIIEAACRIEYPRERLQIQVLDDSIDSGAAVARATCARLREEGVDVEYIHRQERTGFKGGALSAGMDSARGEFIAIFDADFIPPRDFLARTIHYFTDPEVGVVQAKWAHLNRSESLLTECQALFLDAHFVVEQAARASSGRWFNFNGTAGVWRRSCIESSNGWQHDTLTEDTDLSYRAQMAGWRFVYLPSVEAPAELPSSMGAFLGQQHRWTKGLLQNAVKLFPRIVRSRSPGSAKVEAMFHLTAPVLYPVMFLLTVIAIPATFVALPLAELRGPTAWLIGSAVLALGTLSAVVFVVAGQIAQGRSLWRTLWRLPALMALGVGMSVVNTRAALGGLLGVRSPFVRTPKWGGRSEFDVDPAASPRGGSRWPAGVVELSAAGLLCGCALASLSAEFALIGLPFLLLFASGYLWVGAARFSESVCRSDAPVFATRAQRVTRWSGAAIGGAVLASLVFMGAPTKEPVESRNSPARVGVELKDLHWKKRGAAVSYVSQEAEGLALNVVLEPEGDDGAEEGEVYLDLENGLESLGASLAVPRGSGETTREVLFDVVLPRAFAGELQAFVVDAAGKNQYGTATFVERHDVERHRRVALAPGRRTPPMGYTDPQFDAARPMRRIGLKVSAQSDRVRGANFRPFRGELLLTGVQVLDRAVIMEPETRVVPANDLEVPSPVPPAEFVSASGADQPWPLGYAFSGPLSGEAQARLERHYSLLAGHGLGFTRVYIGDYRTGLTYESDGRILGIEPQFLDYLNRLVTAANKHGITVMLSVMDNTALDAKGVEQPELILDDEVSGSFVTHAIVPMVQQLRERRVIWDLFNEPENVSGAPLYRVQQFVDRSVAAIRAAVPEARLTVVSRSVAELGYWRGRGLDLLSHNIFDRVELAKAMRGLQHYVLDAPVMVAEMDPELAVAEALEALRWGGYRGVGLWGWRTADKYDWDTGDLDRVSAPLRELVAATSRKEDS